MFNTRSWFSALIEVLHRTTHIADNRTDCRLVVGACVDKSAWQTYTIHICRSTFTTSGRKSITNRIGFQHVCQRRRRLFYIIDKNYDIKFPILIQATCYISDKSTHHKHKHVRRIRLHRWLCVCSQNDAATTANVVSRTQFLADDLLSYADVRQAAYGISNWPEYSGRA